MDQKKKVLFIINPIAGTRKKKEVPALVQSLLDPKIFESEITYTKFHGHARTLAIDAALHNVDYVMAVGGDGTVNDIANGLMNTQTTLGIIPCGSGNGLARHLGIPIDNIGALHLLQQQKTQRIDGGLANGKAFFCTAGIGFDAHIGRLFSTSRRRGFNTYMSTTLREIFVYEPQVYTIVLDGETFHKKAFSITLANASQFGNNAYIAPQADIKDGFLDLCIVNEYPKKYAFHLGYRLFNKTINQSRFVETKRVKEITISVDKGKWFHLDGEYMELEDRLHIQIISSCLNVLVP
ncbi:MAG: diacylglycerol kinase family lipid kinase [Bacteroidota bacterium]|nr:diacylglycerol kinase family lipid kinase [Bacteroidota bacterium]